MSCPLGRCWMAYRRPRRCVRGSGRAPAGPAGIAVGSLLILQAGPSLGRTSEPCRRGGCGACSRSSPHLSSNRFLNLQPTAAPGNVARCTQGGRGRGPALTRWLGYCSGQAHEEASFLGEAGHDAGRQCVHGDRQMVRRSEAFKAPQKGLPAGKHLRFFRVVTADTDVLRALSDLSYKKHQGDIIVRCEVRASSLGLFHLYFL